MARDTAGVVALALNGMDVPLEGTAPIRFNRFARSSIVGANRVTGTRREPQPVMIGPVTIRMTENIRATDFTDNGRFSGAKAGNNTVEVEGIGVQVTLADGRTYSGQGFYVVGDVDVDTQEGIVTVSYETASDAGWKESL